MKQYLIFIFFIIITASCGKNPERKEKDIPTVKDMDMSAIANSVTTDNPDSVAFLKSWEEFREAFINNDTATIAEMSFKKVEWPLYDSVFDYFNNTRLVPLNYFVNAPYRKLYQERILKIIATATPQLYASEMINTDFPELITGDSIEKYEYTFVENQVYKESSFEIEHNFIFIKSGNKFKFSGLNISESGSRNHKKFINYDSLYFPLEKKGQDSIRRAGTLDTMVNAWYSEYLALMTEPILYRYGTAKELYRFTWLRSFHDPIAIRIEKKGEEIMLVSKQLTFQYKKADILHESTKVLKSGEWDELQGKFQKLDFFHLQVADPEPPANDGARWILEATVDGKYHFTDRQFSTGDYRALALFMLQLSGLKISEEEIY